MEKPHMIFPFKSECNFILCKEENNVAEEKLHKVKCRMISSDKLNGGGKGRCERLTAFS